MMKCAQKTLVWHIGWPKTGSTSLQVFFKQNQRLLLDRAGILYPAAGLYGPAHHRLATSLTHSANKETDIWKELAAELDEEGDWRTALISSENFVGAEASRIAEMTSILPGFQRIVILAYVRQPDQLIESLFAEMLKSGRWKGGFDDFVECSLQSGNPDYEGVINAWSQAFPGSLTIARPFDRSQWPGGDLIHDFYRAVGLEGVPQIEGLRQNHETNRTPGPEMLSLLREVNRRLDGERKPDSSLGFTRMLEQFAERGVPGLAERRAVFFAPEQRIGLRENYRSVFERLKVAFSVSETGDRGGGGGELKEFDQLPEELRERLLWSAFEAAALALDEACSDLEDSRARAMRLKVEHRRLQREWKTLRDSFRKLEKGHLEISRQYNRTWRRRMVGLRAWWRRLRKGDPTA